MTAKTTCQMLIAACLVLWGCDTKTKNVEPVHGDVVVLPEPI